MSYYRPSQTVAMTRGRGFSSSYRGNSMRSWSGGGDRGRSSYGSSTRGRLSAYSNSMDSRPKYQPSGDRYSGSSRAYDDFKPFRPEISSYPPRDAQRSPERKRLRPEAPSSRRSHEGDGFNSSSSRYQSNSFSEHRSFSRDRRPPSYSASRDDFRRPSRSMTTSTPRGGYRGRISSRGLRGARLRDLPPRRRMVESSYAIRKRAISRRIAIRKRDLSDNEGSEEKDKESENETTEEKKKEINNDGGNEENALKDGNTENKDEKSPKKESEKDEDDADKSRRKEFIKLVCPHCNIKCLTFGKYGAHLHSSRHITAMRHVAMKQKSVLARMRLTQRNAQRELEKSTDDLAPRTNFCPLCKLNYKQPKATHQASDSHKSMKKFLMPYCRVCRITFKSPMLYETHICSIEHIKRKARNVNGDKSEREDVSANEEDLENFMTIDSVGDVDDEEEGKKKDTEGKPKEKINVGIEQIRKVEVQYCELCRMYLPRVDDHELERTLSKHCKQRTHMQRYIRYKEDKEIASRAERLQRKETAEKEREKNKAKDQTNQAEGDEKEVKIEDKEKHSGDDEEAIDDKLWADDVNKDLGDILAEAESGNKSSDEDEDSHAEGQRYDSEKNGEEEKKEDESKEKAPTSEIKEEVKQEEEAK